LTKFIHDAEAVYVEGNRRRRRRKPAIAPEKGSAPKLRGVISRELPMIEGERPGPPDSQACLRPHDRFGQRPPERRGDEALVRASTALDVPGTCFGIRDARRRTLPVNGIRNGRRESPRVGAEIGARERMVVVVDTPERPPPPLVAAQQD